MCVYYFSLRHTRIYPLEEMRRLIAMVLVAVVAVAVEVAAHPATQEVSNDSELDNETARKIIGSR